MGTGNQLRQQLSLRLMYTFFQERTKASYFDRAMQLGEAKYVATGRSFDGMTSSFKELFKRHTHHQITPEVRRELFNARCRGEKAKPGAAAPAGMQLG